MDLDIEPLLADPQHPAWGNPGLPPFITSFRDYQVEATREVLERFADGDRFVFLDAPVGSGKSLIAEMVRRIMAVRSVYTCTTKSLQDQLLRDFSDTHAVLKGRANYPTQHGAFPEINAGDCTRSPTTPACMWCDEPAACGYAIAKRTALASPVAVLNTAYLLTAANGPGTFGGENARDLVVIDECDELESALMSYVEVEITRFWRDKLGIDFPSTKTESAKSNDWQPWCEDALARASAYYRTLGDPGNNVRRIRHRNRTKNLVGRLAMLAEQLPEGGWVYDGYNRREPTIIFRPIMVDKLAPDVVWRHGRRFLLMSGSIISPSEMASSLGLEEAGAYSTVSVKVDWDPARRPFHIAPVANVTFRNQDTAYPELAKACEEIVAAHPGERILVHTVSYRLSKHLHDHVAPIFPSRPILTYTNASEREEALDRYKSSDSAVIFAPSLDRGVDFKDDLARVQVIAKVPFPSLGDKQVKTRANMGRRGSTWYTVLTIRAIIQMIGRGMRHEDDWCVTYLLDAQGPENILKKGRRLLPGWVREIMVEGDRPWLDREPVETEGEMGRVDELSGRP